MLQSMRERMQGIIAGVIVALIAVTFALWGIQYYLRGGHEANVVAIVNGTKITEDYVRHMYNRVQQQELAMLGKDFSFDQQTQAKLKEKVIQQLVKNEVLVKLANKLGLYIDRQQVQAGIMMMPAFQVDGEFSPERFQQILRNFFYSEQDFIQELQNSFMLGQLEAGIVDTSFILPNEEKTAVELIKQNRDFGYFLILAEKFSSKADVSSSEISEYYEQNKDKFLTPEKVSIEYIELNSNALKNKIDASDAKLERFYKEHAELFSKAGKANDKSLPNSAVLPPLQKVKDKVKAAYEHEMLQQMLAEQNDKLTDLTYTNSDSLAPAAAALGLDIKISELFTNQGGVKGIISNPKIVKAAFSDAVLKQGYNSNPIEIGDNDVVVLRIKQHISEAVLPLTKVQAEVIAAIKQNKMRILAKEEGQEILQALKDGQIAAAIAKKYNLVWQNVAKATRQTNGGIDSRILGAAFNLPKPKGDKPQVTLVDLQEKGWAVVAATDVSAGDATKLAASERQKISDGLQNSFKQYEYNLLVGEAMRNAKIKLISTNIQDE